MKKGFPSSQSKETTYLSNLARGNWRNRTKCRIRPILNSPRIRARFHSICEYRRLVYPVRTMIYDVSVPITTTMPVWPGDPPVELEPKSHESRDKTHIVNLTAIAMGSHTGTHIDAPFHMINGGKRLHEFPLETLTGIATVVEIPSVRSIGRPQLERLSWSRVERVLFKTENSK